MKAKILIIILLIAASILCIAGIMLEQHNHESIGVIGGADGPTSIFVTGGPDFTPAVVIIVIILIASIMLLIQKRK